MRLKIKFWMIYLYYTVQNLLIKMFFLKKINLKLNLCANKQLNFDK